MKSLLTLTILLHLLSCGQTHKKRDTPSKTIEVGDYLFEFPPDFELVKEKGIDAYVGKIQGDSMWFSFDFGNYSDQFVETPQEYLDKGHWRLALPYQLMKEGITYDQKNTPKVDVISIRPATIQDSAKGKGCDYIAKCQHEQIEFDYAVYIPNEIKQMDFMIDTVDNQFRKIVLAKDPKKGTTGIYIRHLNSFNESMNSYLALSMATSNLTRQQQEIALRIYKTGRYKNGTK